MELQAAKYIEAGLATIGLAEAGVGIGTYWVLNNLALRRLMRSFPCSKHLDRNCPVR
jgi:hypothetical protein